MSGMPAPSIPNLLTLRHSRGGSGIRARTRGRGGASSSATAQHTPSDDEVIQGTDTDAAECRRSAVELDYLEDPYAQFFKAPGSRPARRKEPLINRGTYVRTTALDMLIEVFLSSTAEGGERQIVSLGAGTDTRPFRLFEGQKQGKLIYHEVDFPNVTKQKYRTVESTPKIRAVIPNPGFVDETEKTWRDEALPNANQYWCHGLDLRDLSKPDATSLLGLRTDVPTLLISECCLCYLSVEQASKVVEYFKTRIDRLSLVIYEPIILSLDDPFGKKLRDNLKSRGIQMPTVETFKTTSEQEKRLKDAGFESCHSVSVRKIWEDWISPDEKERVDSLEGLDELEEWNIVGDRYSISWGWKGIDLKGWRLGPV
ncbi:hypothetical protein NUW58_g3295 [Xylaria curta]|uniref:Uncharacterized protein n=1 Tax=Xylaria curta TaxID=42375 RepID=A0ACC1PEA9_9PEZI|nr:hypothetical protein NUW58_g3295 [Xylaria curta]